MKVALVHDFLTQLGGAERVLETLHEMFPEAPVYTLVYDKERTEGKFENWDIRASFIQKLPGGIKHYKWYLPLMPKAVERFGLSQFDLIISDASAFAKGVKPVSPAKHICYCHTPTRYLWQMRKEYTSSLPYPWIVKWGVQPFLALQKQWDYQAAQRVDFFIANSTEVQKRINRFYGRKAVVIYPPVDTNFFRPPATPSQRDYFLAVGRMEPYKRFDIVIEAFNRLRLPLRVAGTGSQFAKVRTQISSPYIKLLGRVSDEQLRELYQHARAFVFPALEDAGMMVVESLACGTPVIAYQGGGAVEFIQAGKHGEFFKEQTPESLIDAVRSFDHSKYKPNELFRQAQKFNKEQFKSNFFKLIQQVTANSL